MLQSNSAISVTPKVAKTFELTVASQLGLRVAALKVEDWARELWAQARFYDRKVLAAAAAGHAQMQLTGRFH